MKKSVLSSALAFCDVGMSYMRASHVRILLCFALFLLQGWHAAFAVELQHIRTWSQSGTTRVVFDLDHDVDYQVFTLSNPMRLVVDFSSTSAEANFRKSMNNEPLIKDVRYGIQKGHDLRVVLDLNSPVVYSQFPLGPAPGHTGSRLVVDMQQGNGQRVNDDAVAAAALAQSSNAPKHTDPIASLIARQQANNAQRQAQTPPASPQVAQAVSPSANQGRGRNIVVVIDPGHGGKDPGTTGPDGTHEKNLTLPIARRVQALFNKTPGFTAKLTRDGDYFIPLRGRTEIARKDHADFFVSIHVDAASSREARGVSVYALSEHGATSETARWLAQSENSADLMGGDDTELNLTDKDKMLRGMLLDLSMTATINASLAAGHQVIRQVSKISQLHTGRVDQAGFVVLKSPDIPSLLVETGYITNPTEEAMLKTAAHQERLAQAIEGGIIHYFHQHPPPGTYLARQEGEHLATNQYRVKAGDSMESIAQTQHVALANLRKVNHMTAQSTLHVNEILTIP
ncbi:N-acetylmuramoyl-L-alanine amidase AmiC [Halomonadaceae bacterium LMG 33818]|uniref:N-acetylmuramoyl-L-alanine amidase n=1 Tax=Cernens ardua TaxID=3402176 RepID=UPI003EDBE999